MFTSVTTGGEMQTSVKMIWYPEDEEDVICPSAVIVNGREYRLVDGEYDEMLAQARRMVDKDNIEKAKERKSRLNKENYHRKKQDPVWWEAKKEYQRKRYQARKANEQKV
jgi:hypothetical protein|tara:strand:+ start:350 stop:679 length:330 start_codon:yes stop_codon:yes gene_type:complete